MFELFILATIAGFVFFRLHSVLGQRTGHEKTHRSPFDLTADPVEIPTIPEHRVQRVRKKKETIPIPDDHPCAEELRRIAQVDKTFSLGSFLTGAQGAFEMIMKAFTESKPETLKKLLDKNLYQEFNRSLKTRKDRNESLSIHILGFDDVQVVGARLDKKTAYVTVRYDTQQKLSQTVEGQEPVETTDNVIDVWTFSKDIHSTNPNWTLVSTQTDHTPAAAELSTHPA